LFAAGKSDPDRQGRRVQVHVDTVQQGWKRELGFFCFLNWNYAKLAGNETRAWASSPLAHPDTHFHSHFLFFILFYCYNWNGLKSLLSRSVFLGNVDVI
jgi:hypothetical protein